MFLYGTPAGFGAVQHGADEHFRLRVLSADSRHIPRAHLWSQVIHAEITPSAFVLRNYGVTGESHQQAEFGGEFLFNRPARSATRLQRYTQCFGQAALQAGGNKGQEEATRTAAQERLAQSELAGSKIY